MRYPPKVRENIHYNYTLHNYTVHQERKYFCHYCLQTFRKVDVLVC